VTKQPGHGQPHRNEIQLSRGWQNYDSISWKGSDPFRSDPHGDTRITAEPTKKIRTLPVASGSELIYRQNYIDPGRDQNQVPRIFAPIKTAKPQPVNTVQIRLSPPTYEKAQSLRRNPNEIQLTNKISKVHVDQNNKSIAILLRTNRHHKYPNNPARDTDRTKDLRTLARLSVGSPSDSSVQQRPVAAFTFPFKTRPT
jgi:hypothetical protein